MAAIDISQAAGAGFSLIRRRPLSVLVWSLLYGACFALAAWSMLPMLSELISVARMGAGGLHAEALPDEGQAALPRMMTAMLQFQAASMLLGVGVLALQAVVSAAAFRAVLAPEQSGFAYMRIGAAELWIALILFGERIAIGFGAFILAAPFLVAMIFMFINHAWAEAVTTGVLAALVIGTAATWVALRLSLVGPMTVADNQFRLVEGWRLTRGHVTSLLGVGLLLVLIVLALETLLEAISIAIAAGSIASFAGGLTSLASLAALPPTQILMDFAPAVIAIVTLWVLFTGVAQAILCAPWARIYQQLAPVAEASPPAAPTPEPPPPAV